jgi:hypothetical protein
VAEGARLESVWAGNRLVGSNPTPSASLRQSAPRYPADRHSHLNLGLSRPLPRLTGKIDYAPAFAAVG